nr:zinc finger protein 830 [Maniola hyperantus]
MSLRMQVEKKKAQEEMRRLMLERKNKDKKPKQTINNPLAKYNNIGQLMCVLCSSVVRSDSVWKVHINSKQHRNNVEQAKKLKELTKNFTDDKVRKRLATSALDTQQVKKPKGILKNSSEKSPTVTQKPNNNAPIIFSHHDEEVIRKNISPAAQEGGILEDKTVDNKLLDAKEDPSLTQPIPEGFFDDPILDAKARNIEYKDPVEEEWEKFQKEIKEETTTSAEIIAGEQEEATAERQIDEIDEQIRNWSRVLDLELKKEETKKKIQDIEMNNEDDDKDSENEADIDEFLDWRAKKSYS